MQNNAITTYCIAAASSNFFCSKGVFAKSAYAFFIIGSIGSIGIIGPVATFLLAWAMLGEVPEAAQLDGFTLALCGGLSVSLLKEPVALSGDREKIAPLAEPGRAGESADLLPRSGQADRS